MEMKDSLLIHTCKLGAKNPFVDRSKGLIFASLTKIAALLLLICSAQLFSTSALFAQKIQGIVQDATTNEPLPGATIQVKLEGNAYLNAVTDVNGRFSLDATALANRTITLMVRFLGFENTMQDVALKSEGNISVRVKMQPTTLTLQGNLMVKGIRAQGVAPTTYTVLSKEAIEQIDLGQDLPMLLKSTPSVVSTSDAGGGVGYTGIRVRGSDPTRINVTVNGIPINDAESQGVFWVNMPDIAQSVSDIEIQRGVGTSTNGAGAFGATVSLQTNDITEEAYGSVTNGFGAFNTRRHTLEWGTGKMNDHWYFGGRLSKIASDGYIDRARADLQSYYLSAAYADEKTVIKLISFAGAEETYQAWNGTPEARVKNDREGMLEVIANNGYTDEQAQNLLNDGRTFNFYTYDNQVDNYGQDHYQLHISRKLASNLDGYIGLNYTLGRGYFEEFRNDDAFADYGLTRPAAVDPSITTTDLIRRRWLRNNTYVGTWNLNWTPKDNQSIIFGGSVQQYEGDHFGEVIWSEFAAVPIRSRYYEGIGNKNDASMYAKWTGNVTTKLQGYVDLQLRSINYEISGTDNDLRVLGEDLNWLFFNPKAGVNYTFSESTSLYSSIAVANREPVRSDIIDAPANLKPTHESLYNYELGLKIEKPTYRFAANYYLMYYQNQLVVTGQLNDVGANIRQNVDQSYRTGVEFDGSIVLSKKVQWAGNLSLSQNRIDEFTEYLYDYGVNFDEFNIISNEYSNTDIALSPNIIVNSQFTYSLANGASVSWLAKYVGQQFLDNTSDENRALDAYFINDIQLSKVWETQKLGTIKLLISARNVFNEQFENNGYTFGYFAGLQNEVRENYLYPQAGRHLQAQVSIGF
jgi:iron complex outermembrane receptor protein